MEGKRFEDIVRILIYVQLFLASVCGSKYTPLIFVCDEEAGAIFESSADSLDFRPLPIPNVRRPVAVAYSPEEDLIFWIDAENGTLNRAFRNGSGHTEKGRTILDLTIHTEAKLLAYFGSQSSIIFERGYNSAFTRRSGYGTTGHLTSICLHPNTDLYALQNGTVPAIWRKELYSTTETIEKPSLLSPLSMAFDRQGSRLFILDDIKGTVESCGPLGEDHQILLYYQNTKPVDVEWYGGSPLWTDDSSYRGIGFMAKRGGPSTGITSLNQFQKATGIHVYYGQAYGRQAGEDCLEDEFTCNDTLCIPISWRCDGLVDCDDELDEANCDSDEPDSIVFVTDFDKGALFMATMNNLTFTKLPLTGLQNPMAVDFDPVDGIVYWTDISSHSINSARINGSNQKTVIDGLGTPDGMYFDVQTKTIYWTDALNNTIEAVYHNGTGRHNILSDLDKPRAIIIVSTNRMIYWTEWGNSPKIELCDLTGNNRQVVIDTGLSWPNGITYDREGSRLYWCDANVEKIESSDLYGNDRKLILDNSHGTLDHPFDIIFHHGTLMWTDWNLDGIGVNEGSQHAWPKNYILPGGFSRPSGFHVFEVLDINECESNPCMNGGSCKDDIDMFTCTCVPGYVGPTCATEDPCSVPRNRGQVRQFVNGDATRPITSYYTHLTVPDGTQLVARCRDPGKYRLIGDQRRTCERGRWTGEEPECQPVETQVLFYGAPRDVASDGTVVVYVHRGNPNYLDVVCFITRLWLRPPRLTTPLVNDGDLWDWPRLYTDTKRLKPISTDFSGMYTCNGSSSFHSVHVLFKAAECDVPAAPEHGRLLDGSRQQARDIFPAGATVSFECEDDYSLVGSRQITCEKGQWLDDPPVCTVLPTPGAIIQGIVETTENYTAALEDTTSLAYKKLEKKFIDAIMRFYAQNHPEYIAYHEDTKVTDFEKSGRKAIVHFEVHFSQLDNDSSVPDAHTVLVDQVNTRQLGPFAIITGTITKTET